jgi:hypothetical protein
MAIRPYLGAIENFQNENDIGIENEFSLVTSSLQLLIPYSMINLIRSSPTITT